MFDTQMKINIITIRETAVLKKKKTKQQHIVNINTDFLFKT